MHKGIPVLNINFTSMFTMHMQFMLHPYLQWGYATRNTFNILQKVNQI